MAKGRRVLTVFAVNRVPAPVGPEDPAAAQVQGRLDTLAFEPFQIGARQQRPVARMLHGGDGPVGILNGKLQGSPLPQNHGALDHVLELSDVAGPVVGGEGGKAALRHVRD
jgi:hypothetical protein